MLAERRELTLNEPHVIDHEFLTHSQLDRLTTLPYMLDTAGVSRRPPVAVHVQEATPP